MAVIRGSSDVRFNHLVPKPAQDRRLPSASPAIWGGAALVIAFLVINVILTYQNTNQLEEDNDRVEHTLNVVTQLGDLQSLINDAQTGQRGFLITGDERYLEPYSSALSAIDGKVSEVQRLTSDNQFQQDQFPELKARIAAKLAELNETMNLRRTAGFEEAQQVVATGRGKAEMDAVRNIIATMVRHEQQLLAERAQETEAEGRS